MLVNWKVEYCDRKPKGKQPPDYCLKGGQYWFYRYFKGDVSVDVIDIRSFPWLEHFEKEKLRFYVVQTLRILPKMGKYDLIVSHGMQSGVVLSFIRRFWKTKARHIVFDIGAFNSAAESGRALKLMQFASRSLDGVIYHTESQVEYYKKFFPWIVNKSKYIPFGTDVDFFSGEEEDVSGKTRKYILCIGYAKRDWDTLCKAFDRISNRYDIVLRLVGKPDYQCGNPKIECSGIVPVCELMAQIRGAIFGVVPLESFNYSFGQMTLLQQMALGKAVVVADVPSMRGYVKDEDTVLTYPPKDDWKLAVQMERLLQEEELRIKLGKRAADAVKSTYSEAIMAEKIEEFYLHVRKG